MYLHMYIYICIRVCAHFLNYIVHLTPVNKIQNIGHRVSNILHDREIHWDCFGWPRVQGLQWRAVSAVPRRCAAHRQLL